MEFVPGGNGIRQPDELLATKAELTRIGSTKPAAQIDGLLSVWQKRDPITRRELLLTLFDKLAVSDGKIVE